MTKRNQIISCRTNKDIKEMLELIAEETASDFRDFDQFNGISKKHFNYFIECLTNEYNKIQEPTDDEIFNFGRCEGGINY